jgi:transposase
MILAQYAIDDGMAEAHAMISLVEQGWADQNDVGRAFGYAARTVQRRQRRFDEGGLAALGRKGGYPSGRARLATSRIQRVQQLRAAGNSYREIARLMWVSAKTIRKLLRRSGWKEPAPIQPELWLDSAKAGDPNLSAFCSKAKEPPLTSHDTDPSNRGADPLLARLGLLEDAPPLFGAATTVPREGVLVWCNTLHCAC